MNRTYFLALIFFSFNCNNKSSNWITKEEGYRAGLLNTWKFESTQAFLNKTQYCFNKKIDFTDLDVVMYSLVQVADYDLKKLFLKSMKYKWDKMYIIYHEFEAGLYISITSILLFDGENYIGFSMDYFDRKIYRVNSITNFKISDIKVTDEYNDQNIVIITEYNNSYKIVDNKIYIGARHEEVRDKLLKLYSNLMLNQF